MHGSPRLGQVGPASGPPLLELTLVVVPELALTLVVAPELEPTLVVAPELTLTLVVVPELETVVLPLVVHRARLPARAAGGFRRCRPCP